MPPDHTQPEPLSQARPHRVLCNYMLRDSHWSVHFVIGQERIGRWYTYRDVEKVLDILRAGNASPEELAEAMLDIKRWGRGSTRLNLTREQFRKLQGP